MNQVISSEFFADWFEQFETIIRKALYDPELSHCMIGVLHNALGDFTRFTHGENLHIILKAIKKMCLQPKSDEIILEDIDIPNNHGRMGEYPTSNLQKMNPDMDDDIPPPIRDDMPPPMRDGMPPPMRDGMPPPMRDDMLPRMRDGMPPPMRDDMPPPMRDGMPPPVMVGHYILECIGDISGSEGYTRTQCHGDLC